MTLKMQKTDKTYLWYGLTALLVVALIVIVMLCTQPGTAASGIGLTVDPDAGTYVAPKAETAADTSGGIAIPGWGSITIPAGQTEVDVNLMNPEDNAGKYDMMFTVTLAGEDEPLAETGLIPAGQSALKLHLAKPLDPGEYDATVLVQPYRTDGSATNNAEIQIVLIAR